MNRDLEHIQVRLIKRLIEERLMHNQSNDEHSVIIYVHAINLIYRF